MTGPLPKQIRALKNDGSQAPVGYVMEVGAKGVFEAVAATGGVFTGDTIELAITKAHDFSGNTVNNIQPLFPWGTDPVKIADPGTLPAGDNAVGHSISWSPNGEFLCRAHDTTPYVTIYQRSGDVFNKVPNPSVLPGSNANATAWSPDGEFLAVGHDSTPWITVYFREGVTFTKLANPGTLPGSETRVAHWSPNGEYLAVGSTSSPGVTIYRRSGSGASAILTKLADPATTPSVTNGVAFSPNGEFLAVADTGLDLLIYQFDGVTFTKLTDPELPSGTGASVSWSPDGEFLAHGGFGGLAVYQYFGISGTTGEPTFTQLDISVTLSVLTGLAFSPNGEFIAASSLSGSGIDVYQRSGDTFVLLTDPASDPAGVGRAIAWSPNGEFLAIANQSTPFITIYQTSAAMPSSGILIANGLLREGF